jgi:hypothetical protein
MRSEVQRLDPTLFDPAKVKKPIFDEARSRELRDEGMRRAAEKRKGLVAECRERAEWIARNGREITIDDIYYAMENLGYEGMEFLGNAAGSIFKGKQWECVGWRKSTRVSNHARCVRVWSLRKDSK